MIKEEHQQSLLDLMNKTKSAPLKQESSISLPVHEDSVKKLDQLKETSLNCFRCSLRQGCQQVVFGVGNPHAHLMLVGEGPGSDEDRLGMPFVGRAGQLLDRILEAAQIKRDEIYIANVVKCRPPNNRLPFQSEIDTCLPYLQEQIAIIKPQIIVCLGALATRTLIDKTASITSIRGQWHRIGECFYLATFHPAALLRDPGKKKYVWEDFKQVVKVYKNADNGGYG